MRKDSAYREWIILASFFCMGFITDGIQYSYGLLFIEFLREFKQSKTVTSLIGALFFSWYMLGPVASILTNKFGCRTVVVVGATFSFAGFLFSVFSSSVQYLHFSYGCFGGFGFLLMNIQKGVVVERYYEKRLSLATGISVCGSGIGTFVFNPVTKCLIDQYGWRGTLLIQAALVLNCVTCALVLRTFAADQKIWYEKVTTLQGVVNPVMQNETVFEKDDYKATPTMQQDDHSLVLENADLFVNTENAVEKRSIQRFEFEDANNECSQDAMAESRHILKLSLLQHPKMITYIVAALFTGISFYIPFTFIPDMVVSKGLSRTQAAWLLSAIGIVYVVCRVPIGKMADMKWVNRTLVFAVSLCVLGISSAAMPLLDLHALLFTVSILFGIAVASCVVVYPTVLADLFGEENVTDVYGFTYFLFGLGSLISGPLAGALFDATGNYKLTFSAAGASFMLAATLMLLLFLGSGRRLTNN